MNSHASKLYVFIKTTIFKGGEMCTSRYKDLTYCVTA